MKIYLNEKDGSKKIVEAKLIKTNELTVLVQLEDGNIIKRKKKNLPKE